MVDFVPEGSEGDGSVNKECQLVLSYNIGHDLNASEEDTVNEEWVRLLREDEDFDLDKFGGFISARVVDGYYEFYVRNDVATYSDITTMVVKAEEAFDLINVGVDEEDFIIESREITQIIGKGLQNG